MVKRCDSITKDSLSGLLRHHPYLQIFQKEDWRDYVLLLGEVYDFLEIQSTRTPIEAARALAHSFYSTRDLVSPEQKVAAFFSMSIGELQVLKDSHDQFGQRYLETTRAGKSLLQLVENLVVQRTKFSGTGAETLLGSLNDILISRHQMTEDEAIEHHKTHIEAYKEDLTRIKKDGIAAAQLLPMSHSNEALFAQAEEAAIHVLQSIEEVKAAIEQQRKELAGVYFQYRRSAGEVLGTVADFYQGLYASLAYSSYIQAKELLSHIEGFQARFSLRNVDRLLHTIEDKELVPEEMVKRSNLRSFMRQFAIADASIQEKIKSQIRILQQQVLYAVSADIAGLKQALHGLISEFVAHPQSAIEFCESSVTSLAVRADFDFGPVELFDFELPILITQQELAEEGFDLEQERELFLALVRAEEGTLKDILLRLNDHLDREGALRASEHSFPRGLAEYYVLSEAGLFDEQLEKHEFGSVDLAIDSKFGKYVLRRVPDFILKRKEDLTYG